LTNSLAHSPVNCSRDIWLANFTGL